MPGSLRITAPLLDVLEVFIQAASEDAEIHGWAVMKVVKRSGPTVYGVLDRLEDMGWITGRWEDRNPEPNKPRRRFYQLTPTGVINAKHILLERRPRALGRPVPAPGQASPGWVHAPRPEGAA